MNGNGHLPITPPAPSSNPVEAANILKVYYNQLFTQADRQVEELEAELAKARAKRDAAKVLADQAEQMLERVEEFQKIMGVGTEEEKAETSSVPDSYVPMSEDSTEVEEEGFVYFAEDESLEDDEHAILITEDDIVPIAKTSIAPDGTVEVEMLPQFEGMKKLDAIATILEKNSDRIIHRSSIMQELFGIIEDKEVRKVVLGRVGAAMTAGKKRGMWFADPRNEGFYTSNLELIKGNKKAPR